MNIFAGFSQNNWSEGLCPHAWSLASAYGVGSGRKLFEYQFTDMGARLELVTQTTCFMPMEMTSSATRRAQTASGGTARHRA